MSDSINHLRRVVGAVWLVPLLLCATSCEEASAPCDGVDCSGHGTCVEIGTRPRCECETDYYVSGLACLSTAVDGDGDADFDDDADTDDGGDADADSDGDVEADADGDRDLDGEAGLPSITGIDGTGPEQAIDPRPEDLEAWEARAEDRSAASRRLGSEEQILVVAGENLGGATAASAVGEDDQGTIEFIIDETTASETRLRFPPDLSITGGGMFRLALTVDAGEAEALLYLMRGEAGTSGEDGADGALELDCEGAVCTIDRDFSIEGELAVGEDSPCPLGYTEYPSEVGVALCRRGDDELVKVGDFWVDRYEAGVWENEDCSGARYGERDPWDEIGRAGQFTEPLYACSTYGVRHTVHTSWFQAQVACTASGKRLLTNAEWQAAVAGTVDPGESDGSEGRCLTAGLARRTGEGAGCSSFWGAEDMIGNSWEWVADWYGQGANDDDGSQECEDLEGDGFWNVDPAQHSPCGHLPAAGSRGGDRLLGIRTGAFCSDYSVAPTYSSDHHGFRCGRGF